MSPYDPVDPVLPSPCVPRPLRRAARDGFRSAKLVVRRTGPLLLFAWALFLLVGPLRAQGARGGERAAQAGARGGAQAVLDSSSFAALEWRFIGPAVMGGRIADFAVVESDPRVFYVGTATGGVWKTTSHGASFEPLFDDQPTSTIGDVTVAPSNPNSVWVGTGEPQNRQSSPYGYGLFRSLDAGRTWEHRGLEETRHIARIVIHPADPEIVYVAAVGHLWGPNPERGVFRTRDGGSTWQNVLSIDENTGVIDLAMDPDDPRTLFAAAYERRRTSFGFNGGGPGSGIYRTLDGGVTWMRLTKGLPQGPLGRIGLDVHRRDGDLVYAIVEAEAGKSQGVYRSTDRGETWEHLSDENPRPMYYSQIRIDPNDPKRIYMLGASFYVSDDGGRTFRERRWRGVHGDHHALWIDPNDSNHVIMGSDGGVYASFDRTESWRMYDNMALGQFYEIGLDMRDPYYVCGGLQDNGSWCGPSRTHSSQGILNRQWYRVGGGDGFYARIDPREPTIIFSESQNGNLLRVDLNTFESARIRPVGRPAQGEDDEPLLRWNWNTPLVLSAHDPRTIYYGANILFRSRDRGHSWEAVSPDLTKRIDRDTLAIMGVKGADIRLSRNDGISSYGNITTIGESPLNSDVLYVGTDDGNLQVTRDGGRTWANVVGNVRGVPELTYVSRVLPSAHAEARVYATFDGHDRDDYRPYVLVSEDYGRTWRPTVAGLPEWSVNVIAEHPKNADLLFVGNEIGVYFSIDRGQGWTRLKNNLPTAPVDDIKVHPRENDLVIGTHGRSIWILDDITPLEQLTPAVLASASHIFPVRPPLAANRAAPEALPAGAFAAPNPPDGAMIRYYLGSGAAVAAGEDDGRQDRKRGRAKPKVKLSILDTGGTVVRELEGPGTPGMHQVVWDLRLASPVEEEGGEEGGVGFFGRPRGPRILPGSFTVRLEAGSETRTTELVVKGDPRVTIARADLDARQRSLITLYGLAKPIQQAVEMLQRASGQLSEVQRLLDGRPDSPGALKQEVERLKKEAERLGQRASRGRQQALTLFSAIEGCTCRPTTDQEWQIERTWTRALELIGQVNTLITDGIPALNRRLDELGVRPEPGKAIELPKRPVG
ncbi:MAG: hypothetical protein HY704_00890 [Gemmatimonadetes bacterium]|nr:hypothetical protein [Gemmatimonadota bacterium]